MTKISSTYNSTLQGSTALKAPAGKTLGSQPGTVTAPNRPAGDRITLSEAALAAAARYSQLIPRSADIYAPALPAPRTETEAAPLSTPDPSGETPTSRNMVRTMYAQQQKMAADQSLPLASRLDIRV
ncbi:hypothetical protein Pcar_3442 [Syntrophotalea carbinolica DSM 2380]|uniref:Uncharacterized protein n=1 Tax=Syntrophotalea carbinolica (strain DSM 2380 / NBRC 103641 / GraBd1) TaxID=338963 RepID=J9U3U3_SYNC1|nr:hypothetical protein [Syntrophotalea carbinolica]AFR67603.1 hypothetical protein Pcar_3442 [Syntrophotalea carbinolica DSM 2380]